MDKLNIITDIYILQNACFVLDNLSTSKTTKVRGLIESIKIKVVLPSPYSSYYLYFNVTENYLFKIEEYL